MQSVACLACLLAVTAADAVAAPARGFRSLVARPVAARGGVLMLPLAAQRPGREWPASIPLHLTNGATIEGTVVWITPRPVDPVRRREWSDDPTDVIVRPVALEDDSSRPAGGAPYLLARLPRAGGGPIRLERQVIQPFWRDPRESYGTTPLPGAHRPEMFLTWLPDRPDPFSPFEYWRWALLADRIDLHPPPLDRFGPVGSLVAEHYAGLWRIGLANLGRRDPALAAAARDVLTRLADDGRQPFAAWVSGTSDPAQLLSMLLDFDADDQTLVREVRAWIDARPKVLAWPEAESGDRVRLAVVNRGFEPIVARVRWEAALEPPLAVELPAGALTRVVIERPPRVPAPRVGLTGDAPVEPGPQVVVLSAGAQSLRMTVGAPAVIVRPPGTVFPAFRPALTLADIQSGQQLRQDPRSTTTAHIRQRSGLWEIFFECRRPAATSEASDPSNAPRSRAEVAGHEAVTVILGAEEAPDLVLYVPEHGAFRVLEGTDDGTLGVHRRSFVDRWHCRVVLPASTVSPMLLAGEEAERDVIRIGALRSHGGGDSVETAPAATVPWRRSVAPAVLIVDEWDRARVGTVN